MGVFAIGINKAPAPPGCGSFASIAAAIASPQGNDDFGFTMDLQVDSGEFAAFQVDTDGGSSDFYVNFECVNISDNAAAMTIYTVSGGGSTIDTVIHADGVINPGDESILIPSAAPFYFVIQNVGGDSCDIFEATLYAAT
jgi:hypothetical protein